MSDGLVQWMPNSPRPPVDLDGTSSAAPDDPVLEWRGADERRDVTLNSSDPAVAFVGITYRRAVGADGRPTGPWRVEYAAVHSWTSSTRRGVGATTRHVLYSADGPMPNLDILALRDMPAWLTRAVGERSPNGAPA